MHDDLYSLALFQVINHTLSIHCKSHNFNSVVFEQSDQDPTKFELNLVDLLLESYHLKHKELDDRVVERYNSFYSFEVEEHSFDKDEVEVEGLCANS